MPKKSVKHHAVSKVEEVREEKPAVILKAEVVEEKPAVSGVSQLAAVVEPVVEPAVVAEVVPPPVETPAPATVETKPETQTVSVETPVTDKPVKKKWNFWPVWIVLAFAAGVGAGFLASRFDFSAKKATATTTVSEAAPESTPSAEPTVATEKAFDRGTIKVKMLNGSGVKGAASVGKEYLEGLGYKEVVVGNADTSDFEVTEVSIKDSLKEVSDKIRADLAGKYTLEKTSGVMAGDDEFDVLVIIGSK